MREFIQAHPIWAAIIIDLLWFGSLICFVWFVRSLARQVVTEVVKLTSLREPWATQQFDKEEQRNRMWRGWRCRKCAEEDQWSCTHSQVTRERE